jgi:MFS family permease
LIRRGQSEEASKSLFRLRPAGWDVGSEIEEIEEAQRQASSAAEGSWSELFALRRVVVIGLGAMFFQQMTGINAVMYYSGTIFGFANVNNQSAATIGVTALNVAMTVVSVWLIDRIGKKPLLLGGISLMTVSLTVAGVALIALNHGNPSPNPHHTTPFAGGLSVSVTDTSFFFLLFKNKETGGSQGVICVVMVLLFVAGFAVGLGAALWPILSEIFPSEIRSKGMSFCLALNWTFNLILTLTVLNLIQFFGSFYATTTNGNSAIEHKYGAGWIFIVFAVLSILALAFVYFLIPETKGKTLEEVQRLLKGK